MKKLLLLFNLSLCTWAAFAQDFAPGKFDQAEMDLTRYAKDTSAHAVVLKEFGKTWISSTDEMPLVHEYHVKIKILDTKGFGYGDVEVGLYHHDGDQFETIREIKGLTFYKDDNGMVQKSELSPQKIYREKASKNLEYVKFALPNLRPGCIVEYSYITESPYRYNFHSWDFQWHIPKMYSEYEVHIPAIYEYNIALRGNQKLSKNVAELERECFSFYGTKADCSKISYVMTDIPAFVEERYMTSEKNYLSAMYFEMSSMALQNGGKKNFTKTWNDVDYELKKEEAFGDQIKRKDLMKDRLPASILSITDTLARAQAVYNHLQNWFKWNKNVGKYSSDGIKKAYDSHTGNVGDINLTLMAALNTVGIHTEAVLISTRDNGNVNKLFPGESSFNYVVARVNIGNQYYMLDATDPLLSFGMLPLRCINDDGRVVSMTKPSYWISMVETQRSTVTSSLDLTLQADGKIKGSISMYSVGYAAYDKRQAIKKFNTTDEYVENMHERLGRIKISKFDFTNLDSLDKPFIEKYDVVIDPSKNSLDAESIAFDPAFWDQLTENPFRLAERSYPVDMGSTINRRLVVTLNYPENYTISKQPEAVAMGLPNKGGRFVTSIEVSDNKITYSQVQQLSKAVYSAQEYPYLKELYNKIIQNQKATVIFRKKS